MLKKRRMLLLRRFYREYIDLQKDKEDEQLIVERIRNGVDFKGANLWVLVFATFIASLGLNVNSTAVIIGAMLISPLMGPIMGVGLAVGQNNFELMKRSLKNLFVAATFSVLTATIYFLFTPLNDVQSELLARTSPSIYDVFIALMGGLAGIVAISSKEKGNVLPGVAIATALMPPLCTAGFGLATGNIVYFFGAFYLFFINSVFISLATFLGVRFMHFERKEFKDKNRERQVKNYIAIITVLTLIPAVYLTYGIVRETFYTRAANHFITEELQFPESQILKREISYKDKEIHVVFVGEEIPEIKLETAKSKMEKYKLGGSQLTVIQGVRNEKLDIADVKSMVMEDFYKNSEKKLISQQQRIDSLQRELNVYTRSGDADRKLASEIKALYSNIASVSIARTVRQSIDSVCADTLTYAIFSLKKPTDAPAARSKQKKDFKPTKEEIDRMTNWLKARNGAKKLEIIIEMD